MKVISSLLMFGGLVLGFITLMASTSAPQQLTSLIPVVGSYVLGRAIENFKD